MISGAALLALLLTSRPCLCAEASADRAALALPPGSGALAAGMREHLGALDAAGDISGAAAFLRQRVTSPGATAEQAAGGLAVLRALGDPAAAERCRDYLASEGAGDLSEALDRWSAVVAARPELRRELEAAYRLASKVRGDVFRAYALDRLFDNLARQADATPPVVRQAAPAVHATGLTLAPERPAATVAEVPAARTPDAPTTRVSGPQAASYVLMGAIIVAVAMLHASGMVLIGLLTFMILDLTHLRVSRVVKNDHLARFLSFVMFIGAAVGLAWYLAHFTREIIMSLSAIVQTSIPRLADLAKSHGVNLPFDTLQGLRATIAHTVQAHPASLTEKGREVAKIALELLTGAFVAVLAFFGHGSREAPRPTLYDAVFRQLGIRLRTFQNSFERVLGVQGTIAAINTGLTSVFLLATGWITGTPFPHKAFLISATLIFSMIPIVGNLLGSLLIAAAGLTVSVKLGVSALVFVFALHKGEYFLNSRIVGHRIKTPMWLTILGMVAGEVLLGLPGVILAPAFLNYLRTEMEAIKTSDAA